MLNRSEKNYKCHVISYQNQASLVNYAWLLGERGTLRQVPISLDQSYYGFQLVFHVMIMYYILGH